MKHFIPFKHLATLVMLLVVTIAVSAAPRSVEEARQAALQQMKKSGPNKVKGKVLSDGPQLVFSKAGKKVASNYYVFSAGKNLGYTIVSGDDRLPAIVGYTESGDFDAARLPEGLAAFMQEYENFVETATDEQISEVMARRAKAPSRSAVAPLMEEKWNQDAPYNGMCPDYQGKKCVTGCVATAAAQIIHYHATKCGFEASLQADIPEYTYKLNGTPITIPGISASEGASYDWANMPNVYSSSATQAQKDAVAKLMLHVGCASTMLYAPGASSAAAKASTFTMFGMDKELTRLINSWDYDASEWEDILYKEIAEKRPVLYSGQTSKNSGHAFDIHGYEDGLYYVNWGWDGYCDGYFDITILNPESGGIGAGNIGDGYNLNTSMVIGIQKENGKVDDVAAAVFSAIAYSFGSTSFEGNKIKATAYLSPWNQTGINQTRYVSVGIKDNNGNITNVGKPYEVKDLQPSGYIPNIPCTVEFEGKEGGVYNLYMIESKDQKTWLTCLKGRKSPTELISNVYSLKVVGGKVTVEEGATSINDNMIDVEDNGAYYNLRGQKVTAPTKGIYIKNGKKYIFK